MRTTQRLVLVAAVAAMFCGVAALAVDPVPLDAKCNPGGPNGRGKKQGHLQCEPLCFNSCERVVCDGPGHCQWHCEPIPGCVPG
jgi:hypothetical protein